MLHETQSSHSLINTSPKNLSNWEVLQGNQKTLELKMTSVFPDWEEAQYKAVSGPVQTRVFSYIRDKINFF